MNFSSNELYRQFRACGRLINDWRDTLGYAALVAIETVATIKTGQPFQLTDIQLCVGMRELGRYAAWKFGDNNLVAGGYGTAHDPDKLANHALTVSMSGMALKFVGTALGQTALQDPASGLSLVAGAAFGAVAIVLHARGDGLKSLVKAYDDIMWDFPRKNKSGGGTNLRQRSLRHASPA